MILLLDNPNYEDFRMLESGDGEGGKENGMTWQNLRIAEALEYSDKMFRTMRLLCHG